MRYSGILVACAVALSVGCHDQTGVIDDSCFMDPAPISARTLELAVGDTVTFTARLGEPRRCLPGGLEPAAWWWSSNDTLVARIDSASGIATAVQPGTTVIIVRHRRVPSVTSVTQLTVLDSADQ